MKIILHKCTNGWVVTDQNSLITSDIPSVRVFETMRGLTRYLLQQTGEAARRDSNGRFVGTKKSKG